MRLFNFNLTNFPIMGASAGSQQTLILNTYGRPKYKKVVESRLADKLGGY